MGVKVCQGNVKAAQTWKTGQEWISGFPFGWLKIMG
jgi:hypothetical protein